MLKERVNDVPSSDVCSKLDVDDYEQVSAINYDAVCFCLGGRQEGAKMEGGSGKRKSAYRVQNILRDIIRRVKAQT